jgi:pimeloyl-ACP methyl ester carboxylesterase
MDKPGKHITAVLLPGMDGTGRLFKPLIKQFPAWIKSQVISYPPDEALDYVELCDMVRKSLPKEGRFIVGAESFSGPIAIQIASEKIERLSGVVLCASFAKSPGLFPGTFLKPLIRPWLFRTSVSKRLAKRLLIGSPAPLGLVKELDAALDSVKPKVLADRLRSAVSVDVSALLTQCPVPLLSIAATEDKLVGGGALKTMLRIRPDIKHIDIKAPHLVLQIAPTESAAAIVRFVNEL